MESFSRFIVNNPKKIVVFYVLLLLPAIAGYILTEVNYDQLDYMPPEMNSRQGEELLQEEFGLSGMGLLLAENKEPWEVEKTAEIISKIRGVDHVNWLGTYEDRYLPFDFMDEEIKSRFLSNDSTYLLQVQFAERVRAEEGELALDKIMAIAETEQDLRLGGRPSILRDMRTIVREEMLVYAAIAVMMILFVLNMSVSSYIEPLIFLVSVGVAVGLNMGSNVIQGDITFLTASIAAVMQLGIALDYSIFFIHRYDEEKEKNENMEEAMAATIKNASPAIVTSAMTTVGGFAALMFMRNGMGPDLGFVLGKGVFISLIVNLTLLPSLLLVFKGLSKKYTHRILLPSFEGLSHKIIQFRWVFFVLFGLFLVPSFLAQSQVDFYYGSEHYLPEKAESVLATQEIANRFGSVDLVYVITENKGRLQEANLTEDLLDLSGVEEVVSLASEVDLAIPDIMIPKDEKEAFISNGYRYGMAFLAAFDEETTAFTFIDQIRERTSVYYDEFYVTGDIALTRDMASLVSGDANRVFYVSIFLIAVIIAISFRSIAVPFLLIAAIQLAIFINLSIVYFLGQTVSSLTPMIIGAIQLGATVDYAILFTSRYKENLFIWKDRREAVRKTIENAGRSILTSALTLFSATFGISLIASIKTTREMTMLIGRGAIISMLIIFLWLPSLLMISEKLIQKTSRDWPDAPQAGLTEKNE